MQRNDAVKWLKVVSYIGIYGGLLMPVFFWPVVIFPFVFSKLLFFQFLIGLTFPSYLVLAWIEPRYRPRRSVLFIAIAAYFVAIGASTIFSVDPIRSWWGNQERMNGMFTLLHFFAWLTMTVGLIRTWAQWRRLLIYEVCLSAFMACVSLLQKPFPNLLSFPAGDRVGGLLDNPIYMAAYQIFNLFFLVLLWMKGPSSRGLKAVYILIALLDVGAFVAAQSRGAFAGIAVGLLVFTVSYAILTPSKRTRNIMLGLLGLAVIGYGILYTARNTSFVTQGLPFLARFTNFSATTRTRFIAWEIAWKGFLERPMTGWGFDTFHVLFNQKYNPESLRFGYYETWFDRSHNTIMDVLSMTGLAGFITFIGIWITLGYSVIRARRKGWNDLTTTCVLLALPVAYFVQNLFVFDHPAAFSMSFLLYALVIAASYPTFGETELAPSPDLSTRGRSGPWIALGILQIASVLLVWKMTIQPFRASYLSIKSNQSFANGAYQDAYNYAVGASAIPTPYDDEQTFLQSRNYIQLSSNVTQLKSLPFWKDWHDLIVRITEQHLKNHGINTHPHFIFARFTDSLVSIIPEDAAIADREYKRILELSPERQQMYFSYARFLMAQGRADEARDMLQRAVSFDPGVGEAHWLLGLHLFFDRRQFVDGAKEMIAAMNAPASYGIQDAREIDALGYAYEVLGDKEGLKGLLQRLSGLPQAPVDVYLSIAQTMERNGLINERNLIVNAVSQLDPSVSARLAPLISGSATSITAALNMTKNGAGLVFSNVTSTQETPPAVVATSSGTGPRR